MAWKFNPFTKTLDYYEAVFTPSSFDVHKNGTDQTMTASSTEEVTWSTASLNEGSDFDLANNKYVVPANGTYLFTSQLQMLSPEDIKRFFIYLRLDGTSNYLFNNLTFNGTDNQSVLFAVALGASAGDEFTIESFHNNTVDKDIDGRSFSSYFSGSRIG